MLRKDTTEADELGQFVKELDRLQEMRLPDELRDKLWQLFMDAQEYRRKLALAEKASG